MGFNSGFKGLIRYIHSYSTTKRYTCYLKLFILVKRSACFGTSSISPPIAAGSSSCLTYTVAVYAVLSSWWWTERPSETCRAFYKKKYLEITGGSCSLYYSNARESERSSKHRSKLPWKCFRLYTLNNVNMRHTELSPERQYEFVGSRDVQNSEALSTSTCWVTSMNCDKTRAGPRNLLWKKNAKLAQNCVLTTAFRYKIPRGSNSFCSNLNKRISIYLRVI